MLKKRVFLVAMGVAISAIFIVFLTVNSESGKVEDNKSNDVLGVSVSGIINNTAKQIEKNQKKIESTKSSKSNNAKINSAITQKTGTTRNLKLIWQDDFTKYNSAIPNTTYWNIAGKDLPIYNQEKQIYDNATRNVRVESGNLVLEAHNNPEGITSGRVDTKSKVIINPGSRVEATIKLPKGRGVWPAFWMLSDNLPYTTPLNPTDADWQKPRFYLRNGEIDIMEYYGNNPEVVESTVHTFQDSHEGSISINDDVFHTYWVEWTIEGLTFGVDDTKITSYPASSDPELWPFTNNNQMYLIINLAMGGSGGGEIVSTPNDSWKMLISSVKYYRFE